MQVDGLLIEELAVDENAVAITTTTTRVSFPRRTWVSTHPERPGKKIGPITLTDPKVAEDSKAFEAWVSDPRPLAGTVLTKQEIHYKELWTLPEWYVLMIVLPVGFFPARAEFRDQAKKEVVDHTLAADETGRLVIYILGAYEVVKVAVNVLARRDQLKYEGHLEAIRKVADKDPSIVEKLSNQSPGFWLRLIAAGISTVATFKKFQP